MCVRQLKIKAFIFDFLVKVLFALIMYMLMFVIYTGGVFWLSYSMEFLCRSTAGDCRRWDRRRIVMLIVLARRSWWCGRGESVRRS